MDFLTSTFQELASQSSFQNNFDSFVSESSAKMSMANLPSMSSMTMSFPRISINSESQSTSSSASTVATVTSGDRIYSLTSTAFSDDSESEMNQITSEVDSNILSDLESESDSSETDESSPIISINYQNLSTTTNSQSRRTDQLPCIRTTVHEHRLRNGSVKSFSESNTNNVINTIKSDSLAVTNTTNRLSNTNKSNSSDSNSDNSESQINIHGISRKKFDSRTVLRIPQHPCKRIVQMHEKRLDLLQNSPKKIFDEIKQDFEEKFGALQYAMSKYDSSSLESSDNYNLRKIDDTVCSLNSKMIPKSSESSANNSSNFDPYWKHCVQTILLNGAIAKIASLSLSAAGLGLVTGLSSPLGATMPLLMASSTAIIPAPPTSSSETQIVEKSEKKKKKSKDDVNDEIVKQPPPMNMIQKEEDEFMELIFPGFKADSFMWKVTVFQVAAFFFTMLVGHTKANPTACSLYLLGASWGPSLARGELWRLVMPMALHANLMHLFFNVFFQLRVGFGLERQFGKSKMQLLYLMCGVVGNLISVSLDPYKLAVGASTAGFGLIGVWIAEIILSWELLGSNRDRTLIWILFMCVSVSTMSSMTPNLDLLGHLGGSLGGLLTAIILADMKKEHQPWFYEHAKRAAVLGLIAVFGFGGAKLLFFTPLNPIPDCHFPGISQMLGSDFSGLGIGSVMSGIGSIFGLGSLGGVQ